jgi:hypothetical protein
MGRSHPERTGPRPQIDRTPKLLEPQSAWLCSGNPSLRPSAYQELAAPQPPVAQPRTSKACMLLTEIQ